VIVLDTNVISELMRALPEPAVADWFARQSRRDVRLTAVTVGELGYGIARLPSGRRRDALSRKVASIASTLAQEVLPYDHRAAEIYGVLLADRESRGRPMGAADAQIAAICLAHDATLATRNRSDFENTGLDLVDPWDESSYRGAR